MAENEDPVQAPSARDQDGDTPKTDGGSEAQLGLNEDWSDSSSGNDDDYDNQAHGTLPEQVNTEYPFHDAIENNDSEAFKKLLEGRKEKFDKFKEAVLAAQQDATYVCRSGELCLKRWTMHLERENVVLCRDCCPCAWV